MQKHWDTFKFTAPSTRMILLVQFVFVKGATNPLVSSNMCYKILNKLGSYELHLTNVTS